MHIPGDRCETNIDECGSSPCLHGARCEDGINEFSCRCEGAYTGTLCETHICEVSGGREQGIKQGEGAGGWGEQRGSRELSCRCEGRIQGHYVR